MSNDPTNPRFYTKKWGIEIGNFKSDDKTKLIIKNFIDLDGNRIYLSSEIITINEGDIITIKGGEENV